MEIHKMSEICKFELRRPNSSSTLCGAYSQSKTPDGKIWAHYPECTESYCPLKHPELLLDAKLPDADIV